MIETVAVVDHSPAIRTALERALRKHADAGVEIAEYEEGLAAIRDFTELDPDMVLIESEPLGVEAYDAVQAMILERPGTKIVAVTELSREAEPIQELLGFGLFDVLEKPVRSRDVGALLDEVREEQPGAGRIR